MRPSLLTVDSVSEWTLAGGPTANTCADVCFYCNVTKYEALSFCFPYKSTAFTTLIPTKLGVCVKQIKHTGIVC